MKGWFLCWFMFSPVSISFVFRVMRVGLGKLSDERVFRVTSGSSFGFTSIRPSCLNSGVGVCDPNLRDVVG
jgi:hypothetical protein